MPTAIELKVIAAVRRQFWGAFCWPARVRAGIVFPQSLALKMRNSQGGFRAFHA